MERIQIKSSQKKKHIGQFGRVLNKASVVFGMCYPLGINVWQYAWRTANQGCSPELTCLEILMDFIMQAWVVDWFPTWLNSVSSPSFPEFRLIWYVHGAQHESPIHLERSGVVWGVHHKYERHITQDISRVWRLPSRSLEQDQISLWAKPNYMYTVWHTVGIQ